MRPVLCLVTDRRQWGHRWLDAMPEHVAAAARNGVHLVQVRERDLDGGPLFSLVTRCLRAVRGTSTRVIVNDRLDIALAAGAHGVHLRADSATPARVRAECPRPFLLGRSIHDEAEASRADTASLDYLIFGTLFPTPSKPQVRPAGLDALTRTVAATPLPVLAIGGIDRYRIADVVSAGAAGVAGIRLFGDMS